jgi:enoyl-[acyl-carrier protein] reductase I
MMLSLDRAVCTLKEWGKIDFLVHAIAFSDKNELTGRFINTTRENFCAPRWSISCFSFIDVARRASEMMPDGGTLMTLTYQGSNRVTPNYNVMGVAKAALESAVRYLANDLGPQIRVNAISPGPMKTLAGAAIGGARKTFRQTEANAPLRVQRDAGVSRGHGSLSSASDYGCFTTGEIVRVDGGYHVLGMPQPENLGA